MTVFWRGNDITNKPTLIYHDEVETVNPPVPMLINPDGNGGLLCNSTVGSIAWHPGNGRTLAFDVNTPERLIYQIIPTGSTTMAQIVNDGRTASDQDISGFDFHNGLFTCRRNGDISTAVPVGLYQRGGRIGELICVHNKTDMKLKEVQNETVLGLTSLTPHYRELADEFLLTHVRMYVLMLEFLCMVNKHVHSPHNA